MPDALIAPARVSIDQGSYLARRIDGNVERLKVVDTDRLLAGFRTKPGEHPWIGEHVGKWIHAATLAWQYGGDPDLRAKLDAVAADLIATQEADGYLGTYVPGMRFGLYEGADWDVWTHKYCLIGLLAYHEATGDQDAIEAARRVGDLLIATFGDGPDQRAIVAAGTHMGMAATSVLEPTVGLFRLTGDPRYLDFARYIVASWDGDGGPRVLSTLLHSGRVFEVGNGKAYEMLSNIVGLADLARVTGESEPLIAAQRAWRDVVDHHLYVTGSASFGEHFHHQDELPDATSVNVGETCVTVTWLQLTQRLLAMTGEAQYAEEFERTVMNHLSAAQLPDGSGWCYYTPLDGAREFGSGVSCCISSGPRGMALAPWWLLAADAAGETLVVSWYTDARASVTLGGEPIDVRLSTGVPLEGGARLAFTMDRPATFAVRLRVPAWASNFWPDGSAGSVVDGWLEIPAREYRPGDEVAVAFDVVARIVEGSGWNSGRRSVAWGPLVLGYRPDPREPAVFDTLDSEQVHGTVVDGEPLVYASVHNRFLDGGTPRSVPFSPFAVLGADSLRSRVWLEAQDLDAETSVFHGADADPGGEFADYDEFSFASSPRDDGPHAFTLRSEQPVQFTRVRFSHGRSLVHGGWFDTSISMPVVEVKVADSAPWEPIATLADYPVTSAEHDGGLVAGQRFEVDVPVTTAVGLRVRGTGSYGEYPPGRFVTCAELQAFG